MAGPYQSRSAEEHREQAPQGVACGVVTVSDTRTLDTDQSGAKIVAALQQAGHTVLQRTIVADEPAQIEALLTDWATQCEAILLTGGTGIAPRDQTPETLDKLLTQQLPGYGELLRMLSYQAIGPAAMLSRASGGLIGQTVVLTMPGSLAAVRLAMEQLILPELGHLVSHARR
jgi:molybdenum cofactor biosynthesis protein B